MIPLTIKQINQLLSTTAEERPPRYNSLMEFWSNAIDFWRPASGDDVVCSQFEPPVRIHMPTMWPRPVFVPAQENPNLARFRAEEPSVLDDFLFDFPDRRFLNVAFFPSCKYLLPTLHFVQAPEYNPFLQRVDLAYNDFPYCYFHECDATLCKHRQELFETNVQIAEPGFFPRSIAHLSKSLRHNLERVFVPPIEELPPALPTPRPEPKLDDVVFVSRNGKVFTRQAVLLLQARLTDQQSAPRAVPTKQSHKKQRRDPPSPSRFFQHAEQAEPQAPRLNKTPTLAAVCSLGTVREFKTKYKVERPSVAFALVRLIDCWIRRCHADTPPTRVSSLIRRLRRWLTPAYPHRTQLYNLGVALHLPGFMLLRKIYTLKATKQEVLDFFMEKQSGRIVATAFAAGAAFALPMLVSTAKKVYAGLRVARTVHNLAEAATGNPIFAVIGSIRDQVYQAFEFITKPFQSFISAHPQIWLAVKSIFAITVTIYIVYKLYRATLSGDFTTFVSLLSFAFGLTLTSLAIRKFLQWCIPEAEPQPAWDSNAFRLGDLVSLFSTGPYAYTFEGIGEAIPKLANFGRSIDWLFSKTQTLFVYTYTAFTGKPFPLSSSEASLAAILQDVSELFVAQHTHATFPCAFTKDPQLFSRANVTIAQYDTWRARLPSLSHYVQSTLTKEFYAVAPKVDELRAEVRAFEMSAKDRITPVWISIFGDFGRAKSTRALQLMSKIYCAMQKLYPDDPYYKGAFSMHNVFTLSPDEEFLDGYSHQPIVSCVEWLASTESDRRSAQSLAMMRMVSNEPYLLPAADMKMKFKLWFDSHFIISTRNNPDLSRNPGVTDPAALASRQTFLVEKLECRTCRAPYCSIHEPMYRLTQSHDQTRVPVAHVDGTDKKDLTENELVEFAIRAHQHLRKQLKPDYETIDLPERPLSFTGARFAFDYKLQMMREDEPKDEPLPSGPYSIHYVAEDLEQPPSTVTITELPDPPAAQGSPTPGVPYPSPAPEELPLPPTIAHPAPTFATPKPTVADLEARYRDRVTTLRTIPDADGNYSLAESRTITVPVLQSIDDLPKYTSVSGEVQATVSRYLDMMRNEVPTIPVIDRQKFLFRYWPLLPELDALVNDKVIEALREEVGALSSHHWMTETKFFAHIRPCLSKATGAEFLTDMVRYIQPRVRDLLLKLPNDIDTSKVDWNYAKLAIYLMKASALFVAITAGAYLVRAVVARFYPSFDEQTGQLGAGPKTGETVSMKRVARNRVVKKKVDLKAQAASPLTNLILRNLVHISVNGTKYWCLGVYKTLFVTVAHGLPPDLPPDTKITFNFDGLGSLYQLKYADLETYAVEDDPNLIFFAAPGIQPCRDIRHFFQDTSSTHIPLTRLHPNMITQKKASNGLDALYVTVEERQSTNWDREPVPVYESDGHIFDMPNGQGYCGLPYFADLSRAGPHIIGIHSGGDERSKTSLFAAVHRTTIDLVAQLYEQDFPETSSVQDRFEQQSLKEQIHTQATQPIAMLSEINPKWSAYLPQTTKLIMTEFHPDSPHFDKDLDLHWVPTREPAKFTGMYNGKAPLSRVLCKYAYRKDLETGEMDIPNTTPPLNLTMFDQLDFSDLLPCSARPMNLDWLTVDEAINGCDGIDKLDITKSSGYPFALDGKKRVDVLFENQAIHPDFLRSIEELTTQLETAEVNMVVLDQLKDELLPISDRGKVRLFCAGELKYAVLCKMVFGRTIKHLESEPWRSPVTIGLNPHSNQWGLLYNRVIDRPGAKLMAGDFSGFEFTLPAYFVDLFIAFFDTCYPLPQRQAAIRRNLIRSTLRCYHVLKSRLYLVIKGNSSGNWLTAFFNSFCNWLIHKSAFAYLLEYEMSPQDFQLFCQTLTNDLKPLTLQEAWSLAVQMGSVGDDSLVSVVACPQYNMHYMSRYATYLGMTYTSCVKGVVADEYVSLQQVDFLKRKFIVQDGWVYAPLAPASLWEIPMWEWRGAADRDGDLANSIRSMLIELVHYSRSEYDRVLKLAVVWAKKRGKDLQLPTYDMAHRNLTSASGSLLLDLGF